MNDDGIKVVNPKVKKGQPAPDSEVEEIQGLGVFAGEELPELNDEDQAQVNSGVVQSLRESPTITIAGLELHPVTLSSMAMLQEIKSIFVSFNPELTPLERIEFQKFANIVQQEGEDALTKRQMKKLEEYIVKAKKEQEQAGNTPMEVLKFFAVHDPNITEEEREEMVFDDPKKLRHHALALGKMVDLDDLEVVGEEIGAAIQDAKSTKVQPVVKEPPSGKE